MAVTAPEQKWLALDRANEVRSRRRELKRQLAARVVALEDVIREPEWWLLAVAAHELLAWGVRVVRCW